MDHNKHYLVAHYVYSEAVSMELGQIGLGT